ncbi:hypothetical protein B4U80_13092 [Leptotrombidium deliense]|uniref:Sushi domain-containing protein n=1 Tax=Leptotrombidium deliense TaxID=299467 RepID=A0A443SCT4_9ACAR|nr:hypothetical protein B4U80_13092 [Leptotrombidium deliense]
MLLQSSFECTQVDESFQCLNRDVQPVESLRLRFDKEINNNTSVQLFTYFDDPCNEIDVPAFAVLKTEKICKGEENCTRHSFECTPGFQLHPKTYMEINCDTDSAKIPLCVPDFLCPKLPIISDIEHEYSQEWNATHVLPKAVVEYKCKDKDYVLRGEAVRKCRADGTWSKSPAVCEFNPRNGTNLTEIAEREKPKEQNTKELFNVPMLITLSCLVVATVLIVFFLIIVIHKRNQRIAQLQRLGSLRSRNFYFDVPIQAKPSYKHGIRVDDNIGLTNSDYNTANRDTTIFYTKEESDNGYTRSSDRYSLPNKGFQYETSANLPAVLITDDPTIPQISL